MKRMSPKMHGVMDYTMSALLISLPWLFGFANNGIETRLPVILGVFTLLYSLLTRYDLGAIYWIGFRTHLVIDFLSGILLLISPWIFMFAGRVYLPHVIAGIIEILIVLVSNPKVNPGATDKAHLNQQLSE